MKSFEHSNCVMTDQPSITDISKAKPPFYWGVDIGGTGIKFGLVDDRGKTIAFERIPTQESDGPAKAVKRIVDVIQGHEQRLGIADNKTMIGIGAPGPMNLSEGCLWLRHNCPLGGAFRFARRSPISLDDQPRY
jgi:glucokinase